MLNAQQSEAVKTVEGPVLLLAVPGSGKTTVLVLRLGYMILNCGIAPENILTVTYTVAATQDMAKRFAGYFGGELAARLEFRTINGICAKIIAYYSRAIGKKPFELVTDEKSTAGILTQIYQQVEQNWPTEADLRNVRTLITYIKNQMLTEKEIKALRKQKGSPLRAADRFIQKNTLRHAKHMVCADGAAEGPEVREVICCGWQTGAKRRQRSCIGIMRARSQWSIFWKEIMCRTGSGMRKWAFSRTGR